MPKAETIQISLRINQDVYEMLKRKTSETGRSLNAEVIQAIIEHCTADSVASRLEKLEQFVTEFQAHKT